MELYRVCENLIRKEFLKNGENIEISLHDCKNYRLIKTKSFFIKGGLEYLDIKERYDVFDLSYFNKLRSERSTSLSLNCEIQKDRVERYAPQKECRLGKFIDIKG